ncbi:MAG: D-alanyl-D-alanine carboxypeptidase family protein [Clostridium sp.]
MKRIISLILSAMMVVFGPAMTALAKPAWPSDTGIQSEAGIVMDMNSRAVLFGQNIHVQKAPASITKLLTALVVVENSNMSDMVTISHDAVYDIESGSGNKLSLEEGDSLSVEDCLYILLLQSSNQIANALAEHVAGSKDAFVELMNKKVQELGCEDSHFANPSGLNDDTQLTSAYDMALIGIAAYDNPKLLEINSAKSHKIPVTKNNPNGASFAMEHKLLTTTSPESSTYYPDAIAGKTGYTSVAGQTLVTYAKRDEKRLIAVTLKSTSVTHYKDTIALLNFGFDRFENLNVVQAEAAATGGPITLDGYDSSDLSIDPSAAITIPKGATFADLTRTLETELPEKHPNGAAARLSYTYDDRKVGEVYIISTKKTLEDATAPEKTGEDKGVSADGGTLPDQAATDKKVSKAPIHLPIKGIVTAIGILFLATIICGGFILYKKKKEEERLIMEDRKRRRRQRLADMGCSEDEFRQMLEKRTSGNRSSHPERSKNIGRNVHTRRKR